MAAPGPEDRIVLDADAAQAQSPDGWRVVDGVLTAVFDTGDFATGLHLVTSVADIADAHDHHPEVRLVWSRVEFHLSSHDVSGITARDVRLAAAITQAAAAAGVQIELHHA